MVCFHLFQSQIEADHCLMYSLFSATAENGFARNVCIYFKHYAEIIHFGANVLGTAIEHCLGAKSLYP